MRVIRLIGYYILSVTLVFTFVSCELGILGGTIEELRDKAIENNGGSISSSEDEPIQLEENIWANGGITSKTPGKTVWYSFEVTQGTTYYVWWNDKKQGDNSKTSNIFVIATDSIGTSAFTETDSGWSVSKSFEAASSGVVKLKVYSNDIGTFAIAYSTKNTMPGSESIYTVTYGLNGGYYRKNGGNYTSHPDLTTTAKDGTAITLLDGSVLSKSGYTFDGWNTKSDGTGTNYAAGASYIVTGNITLYAKWNNRNNRLGSKENPRPMSLGVWEHDEITVTTPDGAVWYSFEVFDGNTYYVWWNDSYQGDKTKTMNIEVDAYYTGGSSIFEGVNSAWLPAQSFTANRTGVVILKVFPYSSSSASIGTYAIAYTLVNTKPIDATTYTVTYNINNGYGITPDAQTVNVGSPLILASGSEFSRSGYTFGGWNTSPDGIGANYAAGDTYTVTGDITLYAKWDGGEPSTGTETDPHPLTVGVWKNDSIVSSIPNRAIWYSFYVTSGTTYYIWWNDKGSDGSKTLDVAVSAYYSSGTSIFTGKDVAWSSAQSFTPTTSGMVKIKVYPWFSSDTGTFAIAYSTADTRPIVVPTYTVTYNINNGSGTTPASQTVNTGSSVILASGSGLSRNGYMFDGWNTNPDGTGTDYAAGDTYTVTGNITLYAKWDGSHNPLGHEANPHPLTLGIWEHDEITVTTPDGAVWYSFNATNGNTYYIWWNDSKQGNSSKTMDIKADAYYDSGTSVFAGIDSAWSSARSFIADSSGRIKIKVYPYTNSSASTGTYAIAYTVINTKPSVAATLPAPSSVNAIPVNGGIRITWGTVSGAQGYTVYRATSANGTYSAVVTNTPETTYLDPFTGSTLYYYKVATLNNEEAPGNQSAYISSAGSGALVALPYDTLYRDTISSTRAQYYRFQVVANRYVCIRWLDGYDGRNTLSSPLPGDVVVSAYFEDTSEAIFTDIDNGWNYYYEEADDFKCDTARYIIVKVAAYSDTTNSWGGYAIKWEYLE